MSTDANNTALIDSLNRRIAELEQERNKATGEATGRKKAHRQLQEEHNKLKADHEALSARLQKAEASPGEWKTKAEKLQAELRTRDARDAWKEVVGDTLRDKVTLEKLWRDIEYTPGETPLTPEEIAEQLKAARESVPYLFKDADTTSTGAPVGAKVPSEKPPLREPIGGGRGAPVTGANRVTVRKSQLQDFEWKLNPANQKMLTEAQAAGTLVVVDD